MPDETDIMRDDRIDILRFLGLAMIILAHTEPTTLVFQLRNFDVPLMVLVSGMSFRASYKNEPYLFYFFSRIKRLLFPVWLFLGIYFLFVYLTGMPISLPRNDVIISTFMLQEGIGYVWIIRVFLMVALISPFIYSYSSRSPSNFHYFATVLVIYLFYEAFMLSPLRGMASSYLFQNTVLYLVPYGAIFAVGLRMPVLEKKHILSITVVALLVFACWAEFHWQQSAKFIPTQAFKYPPQSYYLSYALFASALAWLFSDKLITAARTLHALPVILYIAQNSIWVYLWHIPLIQAIKLPSYQEYPIVFLVAGIITFLQVELVKRHILPRIVNESLKKNLRILLTG